MTVGCGIGPWLSCVAILGATTLLGCDHVFGLERPPDAELLSCPQGHGLPDEDGDGVVNASDVCPGIADPDQADGDTDGVGDACDPHPTRSGDRIAFAAYFIDGIDGGWTPDSPTSWLTTECATSNTLTGALLSADLGDATSYPAIELRYVATEFAPQMASLRIGLQPTTGPGAACHVDYNDGTFGLFLNNSPQRPETVSPEHVVRFVADDLGVSCSLNGVPATDAVVINTSRTRITIASLLGGRDRIEHIIGYTFVPPI